MSITLGPWHAMHRQSKIPPRASALSGKNAFEIHGRLSACASTPAESYSVFPNTSRNNQRNLETKL
jgi:hypothetical protein